MARLPRPPKVVEIAVLDTLGVALMIAALLLGWLPGPGGIPLFIVGLSLLAINHEWAERHKNLLKKYADRLGDIIFVERPLIQALYDLAGSFALAAGTVLVVWQHAAWALSVGVCIAAVGATLLLGNRRRWPTFKKAIKRKR
jgi:hypothetical protein